MPAAPLEVAPTGGQLIGMNTLFGFSLRFLVSFIAAKLLLRSLALDHPSYLIGLSLLLTANLYWFDFAKYSDTLSRRWNKSSQEDKNGPRRLLPPPGPAGSNGP